MVTDSEYNKVLFFTNESYVNVNHSSPKSYLPEDKNKECNITKNNGKRVEIDHSTWNHRGWSFGATTLR